jgi:glycine betaine/proline transport system substrate-binding protein
VRIPRTVMALALAAGSFAASIASAADAERCRTVRMSDPGWTDISSTNGLVGTVLKGLGYEQKIETLAVPITYRSLGEGLIDAFLGNWMPAQKKMMEPLLAQHKAEVVVQNLGGVKFTLAVPAYVYDAGVKDVADIAKHADKFERKIYGIDSGSAVNQNILRMIEAGDYGFKGWDLVESSEQAMLAQVDRATRQARWVAFVAWEPHPMNTKFKLNYLSGGEAYFGANFGASDVFTVTRTGLAKDCPNLVRLLRQATFTVPMENAIMADITDGGKTAERAAADWLKAHPDVLAPWLAGVTTWSGGDGLAAVRAALARN